MNKDTKQYGLIMSKKAQLSAPKAGNIFGNDDDSDGDDGVDWVKKALQAEGERHKIKKQTRLNMEKALTEDPTIYQYDEVYEDMEKNKVQNKPSVKKETKTPKYIHNLLKAAERRKMEQEHRMERLVQKEREAEGEMFADKESFVTTAYREKLEQFKKIEEEEERMDRLEAIADVTKQPDMSGFHRHLFSQKFDEKNTEEVKPDMKNLSDSSNIDRDENSSSNPSSDSDSGSDDDSKNQREDGKCRVNVKEQSKRQYRKRVMEESESDNDEDNQCKSDENDADESPSLSSNHQEVEENKPESPPKKQKISNEKKKNDGEKSEVFKVPEVKKDKGDKEEKEIEKIENEKKAEENKISIWEKRTVGPVFEAALQRYYERKALRLSGH